MSLSLVRVPNPVTIPNDQPDENNYAGFGSKWVVAQPVVAAFIRSVIWNHHDAEDLLQRTAETAIHKYDQYDSTRSFDGWVIGMAKIEVLRYRQERSRDRLDFTDEVIDKIADAYESDPGELHEMKRVLIGCIAKLSGRPKQALELVLGEHLSIKDTASRLKTSNNAVVMAIHRARTLLQKCMERKLGKLEALK